MTRRARQYRALKKRNFIYQIHRHRPNLFGHSPNYDLPPCSLSPSCSFGPRETQLDELRPSHPTLTINFPTRTHTILKPNVTNLCLFLRLYMHDLDILTQLYPGHEPFSSFLGPKHSTVLRYLYYAQCPPRVFTINSTPVSYFSFRKLGPTPEFPFIADNTGLNNLPTKEWG